MLEPAEESRAGGSTSSWESTKHHGLTYDTHDYTHDYSEHVDPSVINGHATAAFRYFHTNIAGYLHLVTEHRSSYSSLRLSDHFNRPEIIEEGENFDHLIRGMTTQSQECTDQYFTSEVSVHVIRVRNIHSDQYFTSEITRYLFRNGKETGQDLRAIDIQRGRDHGLASYNDYRHYCGLHRADKFSDFGDYISQEVPSFIHISFCAKYSGFM
uniref:Uncharacterized protein n=1 Tax=Timema poppense TaxID=170557 RepID=A0A7R9DJU2_TIMPO|nr:unnamed protein product [Timema poppensis]